MTRNPRSTSIFILQMRSDKPGGAQKFQFRRMPKKGKAIQSVAKTTKRTGFGKNPNRCVCGEVFAGVTAAGLFEVPAWPRQKLRSLSEPIEYLVGPEALEAMQR